MIPVLSNLRHLPSLSVWEHNKGTLTRAGSDVGPQIEIRLEKSAPNGVD